MTRGIFRPAVLLLALPLLLAACDESDLTSVRITLRADGSGTVRASSVSVPERANPSEAGSGVTWTGRVSVDSSVGQFAAIDDVALNDIRFRLNRGDGMHTLDVTVPRGANAAWIGALAPTDDQSRAAAARAFDASGNLEALGTKLKIVIELPGAFSSTGAHPVIRGVSASGKRSEATLIVPIERAREDDEPILWHIAWSPED